MVPTSADVDHYRRELAAAGIVFGAEVLTFRRLVREIAAAAGRARAAARAAWRATASCARRSRDAHLRVLAASARAPGFTARGRRAVRRAAAARSSRRRASRARCAAGRPAARRPPTPRSSPRCTRPTTGGWRRSAAATSRATPAPRWTRCASGPPRGARRPVLLYGFDDLTPLQLDAVETLAGRAEAEVWVALPYEAGRAAFAGRAATVELLKPLADARTSCSTDRSEHYARARAPRAAPPGAPAVRGRRRAVPAQRRRAAAGGGRRARGGRARRPPRCSS